MGKTARRAALAAALALLLVGCGAQSAAGPTAAPAPTAAPTPQKEETETMQMQIGDTAVTVTWADTRAAAALQALCAQQPLVVKMSMYGGFEQVGPLGTALPADDVQTTTQAGDIVLYNSDQLVVFYGTNSWAYTRLGHITDPAPEALAALLGQGDVTVTLSDGAGA